MSNLTAGISLYLKDKFTHGIQEAAKQSKKLGDGFLSMSSKVDKGLSGITGTLATIGVSMGAVANETAQPVCRTAKRGGLQNQ